MAKGNTTTGKGKAITPTKAPLKKPTLKKAPEPPKKALMKKKGPQKWAAADDSSDRWPRKKKRANKSNDAVEDDEVVEVDESDEENEIVKDVSGHDSPNASDTEVWFWIFNWSIQIVNNYVGGWASGSSPDIHPLHARYAERPGQGPSSNLLREEHR